MGGTKSRKGRFQLVSCGSPLAAHAQHPDTGYQMQRFRGCFSRGKGQGKIDLKQDEPGLAAFCAAHGWPITFYTARQLQAVEGHFTPSAFVRSVTGVDNVCERAAVCAADGPLQVPKQAGGGVTLALAAKPFAPDWSWKDAEP